MANSRQADTSQTARIALVGAGDFCVEILQKTTLEFEGAEMQAHITAVADPNPEAAGMIRAAELGLVTVQDYHDLYLPQYRINLIILLTPDSAVLDDLLATKPHHIRVISYLAFQLLRKAISVQEEKLKKRNREFKMILDGIADFIIVITPEMEIVEVNAAFLKQMGYTRGEVIGKKCHEVFQKMNRRCEGDIVCPLKEVIRNKRQSERVLTRVDRQGDVRYNEVTIYPIWEAEGKIGKFVEISRDITERIRQEEETTRRLEEMVEERTRQLKETQSQLIHQDKMASLGKLSASVVHEINNPVAGILNLILLMQRMVADDDVDLKALERFRHYLGMMETETRRVSRIISNLLGFSRQSNMELKKFDLGRLIEKTVFLNQNLLKISNVRVKKQIAPDLPPVTGSEDLLQQVFVNMISNAAEAIQARGRGELRIAAYQPDNGSIRVEFNDNGVGIPENNLPRLFEPFFTTKKKGKGVGLGLSVAYGIVQEHGGHIKVTSTAGEGTQVRIELPLSPPSASGKSLHGGARDAD